MTDQPLEPPPPGWYPDPVTGTGHRYWSGMAWTDQHSLDPGGEGGGLQPVGPWLGEAFKLVVERAGHLFTLILILSVPASMLAGAVTYWAVKDGVITFDLDENDAITGVGLVGIEGVRAVAAVAATLLNTLVGVVLAAAVSRHMVFARTDRAESWSKSLAGGMRRMPRVLGVTLLLVLGVLFALTILLVPAAFFPPLYVITIPAAVVLALWAWARLTLSTTAAAVAPKSVRSIDTSLSLSRGLLRPLLGRLLLLTLIVFMAQVTLSAFSAPFGGGASFSTGDTELPIRDLIGGNIFVYGIQQVVSAIASGFAAAIYGSAMALLYLDLAGPLDDEFTYAGASTAS